MALYKITYIDADTKERLKTEESILEKPLVGDRRKIGDRTYNVAEVVFDPSQGVNDTIQKVEVRLKDVTVLPAYPRATFSDPSQPS